MDTTSYDSLASETLIVPLPSGMRVLTRNDWTVPGEQQLSWTSLVRLIECCRELQWQRDVASGGAIESTTRAFEAAFAAPILAGAEVEIRYEVETIGQQSYGLRFRIECEGAVSVTARMVLVFLDPSRQQAIRIPDAIRGALADAANHTGPGCA